VRRVGEGSVSSASRSSPLDGWRVIVGLLVAALLLRILYLYVFVWRDIPHLLRG